MATLCGREHGAHTLVYDGYCLEWTNHYLELDDLATLVPLDDVYSIYQYSAYLCLKLQHRVRVSDDLTYIPEARIEEDLEGGTQVGFGQSLSALWRVNDRRDEHHVIRKQAVQARWIIGFDKLVPALNGMLVH